MEPTSINHHDFFAEGFPLCLVVGDVSDVKIVTCNITWDPLPTHEPMWVASLI